MATSIARSKAPAVGLLVLDIQGNRLDVAEDTVRRIEPWARAQGWTLWVQHYGGGKLEYSPVPVDDDHPYKPPICATFPGASLVHVMRDAEHRLKGLGAGPNSRVLLASHDPWTVLACFQNERSLPERYPLWTVVATPEWPADWRLQADEKNFRVFGKTCGKGLKDGGKGCRLPENCSTDFTFPHARFDPSHPRGSGTLIAP